MSQAAAPLNEAVAAALLADAALVTFLGGTHVYSDWLPPAGTVDPDDYLTLGSDDSAPFGVFNAGSESNGLAIHAWSKRMRANGVQMFGKDRVLALAGHVGRILNGTRLTLDGYGECVAGRADLQITTRDPDGLYFHAVLRYTGFSIRGVT